MFSNHYQLADYIYKEAEKNTSIENINIGDIEALYKFLERQNRLTKRKIDNDLNKIMFESNVSIAEQMIDLYANDNAKNSMTVIKIKADKDPLNFIETKEAYIGKFLSEWIKLEKVLLNLAKGESCSLHTIDINTVINLSSCSNLKELYAEGTNATGVIFANGGLLETAHLPSLTSISMKNLNYIKDFAVDGYNRLQTLIVENVPNINTYDIVNAAPSLKLLRLINLNWDFVPRIENASIFDRLLTIGGIDSSGYESDLSVLTGIASVAVIGQYDLYKYQETWSDLTIEATTIKPQFKVTFVTLN